MEFLVLGFIVIFGIILIIASFKESDFDIQDVMDASDGFLAALLAVTDKVGTKMKIKNPVKKGAFIFGAAMILIGGSLFIYKIYN
ncbi:hypothetical protein [Weissella bombi]|uniref:Uncharacterized protein n=1 Tax=Weissella bombi TaxID=1505725 RepID=A0A1C3Z948_9LACO|nr:hypothetical protein [Weissella bombi]SCB78763.1 hypothetical protein GA0061074_101369 [Weissella bombi]